MQELFLHYTWKSNPNAQTYRIQYTKGPKQLGLKKKDNKIDNVTTIIPGGTHHYQSMKWYLSTLRWEAPSDHHNGTTNAELALDYEAATGMPLFNQEQGETRTVQDRAIQFAHTAKIVAGLCGRKVSPGDNSTRSGALVPFKLLQLKGHDYRAQLKRPIEVAMVFAEQQQYTLTAKREASALAFMPKWTEKPGKPDWIETQEQKDKKKEMSNSKILITAALIAEIGATNECKACQACQKEGKRTHIAHTNLCKTRFQEHKNKKNTVPPLIKKPLPRGKVTHKRTEEHNEKLNKDRHTIILRDKLSLLTCSVCDAIAPTKMARAFFMEDCPESKQTINIMEGRDSNSVWQTRTMLNDLKQRIIMT